MYFQLKQNHYQILFNCYYNLIIKHYAVILVLKLIFVIGINWHLWIL